MGWFAGCLALLSLLLTHGASSTTTLFISRTFVSFAFVMAFVYTPEVYPTVMRSSALGMANIFSRLGGFTAPFISGPLLDSVGVDNSVMVLSALFATGSAAGVLLPKDTKGTVLSETINDLDDEKDDLKETSVKIKSKLSNPKS